MSIFLFKNKCWIQSYDEQSLVADYKISELDLITGKEIFLPFEFKPEFMEHAFFSAFFSVYNDQAVFSFSFDSIMYKIVDQKITPVVRLEVKSTKDLFYKKNSVISSKGFIGSYLFINYEMTAMLGKSYTNTSYLYLENMDDGKQYHFKAGIYDDVYQTGYCRLSSLLNKKGYFYFIKGKEDVDNKANRIKIKEGPVILLVKIK